MSTTAATMARHLAHAADALARALDEGRDTADLEYAAACAAADVFDNVDFSDHIDTLEAGLEIGVCRRRDHIGWCDCGDADIASRRSRDVAAALGRRDAAMAGVLASIGAA